MITACQQKRPFPEKQKLYEIVFGSAPYDDQRLRSLIRDLVNQLILKTIQLKIYYEAAELNLLESHLDSFRHFIRRREVSDYHRTNFSNIICYTRKLISLPPGSGKEKTQLRAAIEGEQILSEKEWLLEKIN